MRLRWLILVTIALGLLIGPLIKDIPGFVVIAWGNYTVQTRLWQAVVLVILLQLLLILLYHLFERLWNGAGKIRSWRGGLHWKKSRQKTIKGMIALSEGDWMQAEKLLTSAVPNSDMPLINYLAAAQAAQAQKSESRRDDYLRQATLVEPDAEIAIGLTQAQLQLDHRQYEQALATLTHLKNLVPKHSHVLTLLQKLYRHLGDWQGFIELLPQLKKSTSLSTEALIRYQLDAYEKLLIRDGAKGGVEAIHTLWMKIPKELQKAIRLLSCYCELLINYDANLEAEKILSNNIRKSADEKLLYLYGKVKADDPSKQLAFVESLSKKFVDNSVWLLTLGRLCLNEQLLGKARNYLEQSIAILPLPETYQELARTFEALGEIEEAKKCYRMGLTSSLDKPVAARNVLEIG